MAPIDTVSSNLDDRLLESFAGTFYGYGSYSARYWFIGKEEGGGTSVEEIATRLTAWQHRGRHELEDLAGYHEELGFGHHFGERPKLQRTWMQLARIGLVAAHRDDSTEEVRRYQANQLGRWGGDACLLELLPLPSPGVNRWLYGAHSRLSWLATRTAYKRHYAPIRVAHLRRRIDEHNPQAVIFYSTDRWYREQWEMIAGGPFAAINDLRLWSNVRSATAFVVMDHPLGKSNDYFRRVGEFIEDPVGRTD